MHSWHTAHAIRHCTCTQDATHACLEHTAHAQCTAQGTFTPPSSRAYPSRALCVHMPSGALRACAASAPRALRVCPQWSAVHARAGCMHTLCTSHTLPSVHYASHTLPSVHHVSLCTRHCGPYSHSNYGNNYLSICYKRLLCQKKKKEEEERSKEEKSFSIEREGEIHDKEDSAL